jgi:WD40 repeat protein
VDICPRCGWTLRSEELILAEPGVLEEYQRRLEEYRLEWLSRQARPGYGTLLVISATPIAFRLGESQYEAPIRLDNLTSGIKSLYFNLANLTLEIPVEILPGEAILLELSDNFLNQAQRAATWAFSPIPKLAGHEGPVLDVAFSPPSILASASSDANIRLWDIASGKSVRLLQGHTDWVNALAFSPDGRLLASAGLDSTLRIWDANSGQEIHRLGVKGGWLLSLTFSPDGKLLATAGEDKIIRLYEVPSWREVHTLKGHTGPIHALAFHPQNPILASGSDDGTIRVWDLSREGREIYRFEPGGAQRAIDFDPAGHFLASGDDKGEVQVWNFITRQELISWKAKAPVRALAFHPAGTIIATAGEGPSLEIWSLEAGRRIATLRGPTPPTYTVAFRPDGSELVAAGSEPEIYRWSVLARCTLAQPLSRWPLNELPPKAWISVHTDREAQLLLDGEPVGRTQNCHLLLSDLPPGSHILEARTEEAKATRSIELQPGMVHRVDLSLQPVYGAIYFRGWLKGLRAEVAGREITNPGATGGFSPGPHEVHFHWGEHEWLIPVIIQPEAEVEVSIPRTLPKVFRLLEGWHESKQWSGLSGAVTALAFAPRRGRIAAATSEGLLYVWEQQSQSLIRMLHHTPGPVVGLAFGSLGRKLLSLSVDGTLCVWDLSSGRKIKQLRSPVESIQAIALSPDGKKLAIAESDGSLRIWNPFNGRELKFLEKPLFSVQTLSFSPDGRLLVALDSKGTAQCWDTRTGKSLWKLERAYGSAIALYPKGQLLALGTPGGAIMVLDTEGGHHLRVLPVGEAPIRTAIFSPDGRWLAIGSADGIVRLWSTEAEERRRQRVQRRQRLILLFFGLLVVGASIFFLRHHEVPQIVVPTQFIATPAPTLPLVCKGGPKSADISRYLSCYNSPLKDKADLIVKIGQVYNVDPRLIVALAGASSEFGKEGFCAQQRNNPWAYPGKGKDCQAFPSVEEAMETVALSLWDQIHRQGVRNFKELVASWCIADCQNWAEQVAQFYQEQGGNPKGSNFSYSVTGESFPKGKFKPGERVYVTTKNLRVRAGPGTNFQVLDKVSPPDQGVVLAGPIARDGYNWWAVRYKEVVGWSVEDGLSTTPPPTPTP